MSDSNVNIEVLKGSLKLRKLTVGQRVINTGKLKLGDGRRTWSHKL